MADTNPTTGELFKAKQITNDEVNRAVAAVLGGKAVDAFRLAESYVIALVAAVAYHPAAKAGLAAEGASAAYRRNLARTAILLARPEKGLSDGRPRGELPSGSNRHSGQHPSDGRRSRIFAQGRDRIARHPVVP